MSTTVTKNEIAFAVRRIRLIADDSEMAHGAEDFLYLGLLRAIAEGRCEDPQACAAEAVKAADIAFRRYRA